MRFDIVAEASAGLLCRLIGLAAQQDLAAPDLQVRVAADRMTVQIELDGIGDQPSRIMAEKMERCIGVETVRLDGVALPHWAWAAEE
jgi:hypothetical protein